VVSEIWEISSNVPVFMSPPGQLTIPYDAIAAENANLTIGRLNSDIAPAGVTDPTWQTALDCTGADETITCAVETTGIYAVILTMEETGDGGSPMGDTWADAGAADITPTGEARDAGAEDVDLRLPEGNSPNDDLDAGAATTPVENDTPSTADGGDREPDEAQPEEGEPGPEQDDENDAVDPAGNDDADPETEAVTEDTDSGLGEDESLMVTAMLTAEAGTIGDAGQQPSDASPVACGCRVVGAKSDFPGSLLFGFPLLFWITRRRRVARRRR
jgi:hypothetical protein